MWSNINNQEEIDVTNARLLKAAPALLRACKKFKEMYIQDTDLNKQTDYYVEVCAAIAKATQ